MIIKNCHENIYLTNNSYTYKHCLDCLVISQDPLPDNESLSKHYKYIDSLNIKRLNSKKGLEIFFKIIDSYKKRYGAYPLGPSYQYARAVMLYKIGMDKAAKEAGKFPTQDQVIAAMKGAIF